MSFNQIFPNIFVINMKTATQRWNKVKTLLEENDIKNFERFSGIVINNGLTVKDREEGCKASHIEIVKIAKQRKLPYVLILEDDIEIKSDYRMYLPIIEKFLKRKDWDLFYLGCNFRCPPILIEPNIVKIPQAFTTHAYVVNEKVYDDIIGIRDHPANLDVKNQIDVLYVKVLQSRGNCYSIYPRLISQQSGFSDIQQKIINYKALRDE